jgi:hypothetical protein
VQVLLEGQASGHKPDRPTLEELEEFVRDALAAAIERYQGAIYLYETADPDDAEAAYADVRAAEAHLAEVAAYAERAAELSAVVYRERGETGKAGWATSAAMASGRLVRSAGGKSLPPSKALRQANARCSTRTRRATPRPRGRRERHTARSTSSSDPGDSDPHEPEPPLGGYEACPRCGHVLLWTSGRLVCPRRGCGGSS